MDQNSTTKINRLIKLKKYYSDIKYQYGYNIVTERLIGLGISDKDQIKMMPNNYSIVTIVDPYLFQLLQDNHIS
jgi:hypothetical protein